MMGPRQVRQGTLFFEFSIEEYVPKDHPLRGIDRFLDLSAVRPRLGPSYSSLGRSSIDPELMIRMLLSGYCMGVRSERRLCEVVHGNPASRRFCRLELKDPVPDRSTFSKNRHGRLRGSGLFRHLFETVLQRCIDEGLVAGESFGVDTSLIPANAKQTRGIDSKEGPTPELTTRVVEEHLDTLDDAAFGASTKVVPKYISPVDPVARRTGADTGYGSTELLGRLVEERGSAPHIPVWDKSKRTDGTFSREDFVYDPATDSYTCPGNNKMRTYRRNFAKPRKSNGSKVGFIRYRTSKHDCDVCPLRPWCCPGDPRRRVRRSIQEAARDAARDIRKTDA